MDFTMLSGLPAILPKGACRLHALMLKKQANPRPSETAVS